MRPLAGLQQQPRNQKEEFPTSCLLLDIGLSTLFSPLSWRISMLRNMRHGISWVELSSLWRPSAKHISEIECRPMRTNKNFGNSVIELFNLDRLTKALLFGGIHPVRCIIETLHIARIWICHCPCAPHSPFGGSSQRHTKSLQHCCVVLSFKRVAGPVSMR